MNPRSSINSITAPLDLTPKLIDLFKKIIIERHSLNRTDKNLPSIDIYSTSGSSRSFDVQLTSSNKNILINYANFCHRAACLMQFESSGPIALRYDVRKWSILRSPFVDKTSFKQYERRSYKRLLRINNAHPSLHQKFLWYVQHHLPSEVEFSSTIYEYESL